MTSMLVTATDQRLLAALAGGSWAEVVGLAAVGGTGAGLGVASVLDSVDPGSLEGGPRVDLVRAWGRVLAMIEGRMQVALASLVDATDALGVAGEQARHEVAAALKLAPATASIRTRVAADLRDRLPDTLRALEAGDISYRQAAAIVDAVRELTDDIATKVEAEVLSGAFRQTLGQTHRSLKRALLLIDPDGAAARRQAALARRSVDRIPQLDSMQAFRFSVPATIGHDWWGVLSSRARDEQQARRVLGRDDPGLDALRVDVLVQALLGNGGADPLDPLITRWPCPGADSGRYRAAHGHPSRSRRRPHRDGPQMGDPESDRSGGSGLRAGPHERRG